MRPLSLLALAVTLGATSAWAQNTQPAPSALPTLTAAPLQLEIAVRGYGADDRARSLAGDSAVDKIESYVWADQSLCSLGSANAAPAATPWVGWHFVGTVQGVVSENGRRSILFRVDWQRMWENGARVPSGSTTSKSGGSTTSLREGERLELDRLTGGPGGPCGTTNVRLEVGSVVRPTYRVELAGRAREMLAGARAAGADTRVLPNAAYADAVKQFKLRGSLAPSSYDAELWLVHRHPDGTETTESQQTVRFSGTDLAFTFPAVVVKSSKGDLTLDFNGTLRAGIGPEAGAFPSWLVRSYAGSDATPRSFYFFNSGDAYATGFAGRGTAGGDNAVRIAVTIARRVRGGGTTPPLDTRGGSYFFMNVPAPADVVSFEFPSLPNAGDDPLKGHTFSLRIRVTPVAK